jgi:hypothetical protein
MALCGPPITTETDPACPRHRAGLTARGSARRNAEPQGSPWGRQDRGTRLVDIVIAAGFCRCFTDRQPVYSGAGSTAVLVARSS